MIRPAKMSTTSVPWSLVLQQHVQLVVSGARCLGTHIKSTLVKTPIVRVPSGSTSRANFKPSELAKSVLAAVTARMMAFGFEIYFRSMSLICRSISRGWSPTGTLVRPGKSTRVKVKTLGEKIRKLIGLGEMPLKRTDWGLVDIATFAIPIRATSLTCVLSRHLFGITHNLFPDFAKVVELLSREMQELSPFIGIVLV